MEIGFAFWGLMEWKSSGTPALSRVRLSKQLGDKTIKTAAGLRKQREKHRPKSVFNSVFTHDLGLSLKTVFTMYSTKINQ